MPVNSVVGFGWNADSSTDQAFRNFTIYKDSGSLLYRNGSLEYYALYYAA